MAGHVRKQIRDAAAAILGALPTTGARVYVGRTRPLDADHLPTLLIYTRDERSEDVAMGPATLMRSVELLVDARVTSQEPPDDDLDAIAVQIEETFGAASTLNGLAESMTLVASRQSVSAEGQNHIGSLALEFRVVYRTREGVPTASV